MKSRNIILLIALVAMLITSCKKDEDTLPPVINIDFPLEFRYYDVYDTINISGNVTDDHNVHAVSIKIVNANYQSVLDEDGYMPDTKTFYFNTSIAINDIHLSSGTYYVLVTATDGTNSKNLFRAININAVPLQFKKIVAITNVSTNSYNVYGVDVNMQTSMLFNYSGDYNSSAINSGYQQLYMCGSINSNMNAYDLGSKNMIWNITPENNPPFPSFNNVSFYNDIVYVSFYNARIVGYNRQGGINVTAQTSTGYTPGKTYLFNNYLLAEEKNTTGTDYKLSVYIASTGFLKASNVTSIVIKGMETQDASHVYIFGNTTANKAVMTLYNVDFNGYYAPHAMPDSTLYDYAKVDANNYLLAIGSNVYWYQTASNSLTTLLTNVNANRIKYESLSGNFIIANGNQIKVYTFPSGNYVGGTSLPYTINDIHLLYNR